MSSTNDRYLLGIETSGKSGSVALLRDDILLSAQKSCSPEPVVVELDSRFGSAKTLAPAIHALLHERSVAISQLSCIAVITGPGSFTGLRVGVTTAKVLAYALRIPIVEVDALDVIAQQFVATDFSEIDDRKQRTCIAIMDAYRGQCFMAEYELVSVEGAKEIDVATAKSKHRVLKSIETRVEDLVDLVSRINRCDRKPVYAIGPGVARLNKFLNEEPHVEDSNQTCQLEPSAWRAASIIPMAGTVSKLGLELHRSQNYIDAMKLLPRYYRASAAEEKRDKSSETGGQSRE